MCVHCHAILGRDCYWCLERLNLQEALWLTCMCLGPVQTQKARVEDMIAEEATIDGLEHIECKIFK